MNRELSTEQADMMRQAEATYWTFGQGDRWCDRDGIDHPIGEMEPRYCSNVIQFLLRRVEALALYHGMGSAIIADLREKAFGPDDDDQWLDELWDQQMDDPVVWMMGTPLVKALVARIIEGDDDE